MIRAYNLGDSHGTEIDLNIAQLSEYKQKMLALAQEQLPRQSKAFLRQQVKKLLPTTQREAIFSGIKHRTYGYYDAIKAGKPFVSSKDKSVRARVYSYAPHSALLEHGHTVYGRGKKHSKGIKRTKAFKVFEGARESYEPNFIKDAKTFVDRMLEKGLLG